MACPFDAITLGNDWELADINRDAMIYTKEMLLDPPPPERRGVTLAGDGLDSPLPVWLAEAAAAEAHGDAGEGRV
jgi:hypothetical protein